MTAEAHELLARLRLPDDQLVAAYIALGRAHDAVASYERRPDDVLR